MLFGLGTSLALFATETIVDSVRVVTGTNPIRIRPRDMRQMLLTLEDSVQGKIPAILGDDQSERVETIRTLLKGTTDEDLNLLIGALQEALTQRRKDA